MHDGESIKRPHQKSGQRGKAAAAVSVLPSLFSTSTVPPIFAAK
jgi:hypothetical protein